MSGHITPPPSLERFRSELLAGAHADVRRRRRRRRGVAGTVVVVAVAATGLWMTNPWRDSIPSLASRADAAFVTTSDQVLRITERTTRTADDDGMHHRLFTVWATGEGDALRQRAIAVIDGHRDEQGSCPVSGGVAADYYTPGAPHIARTMLSDPGEQTSIIDGWRPRLTDLVVTEAERTDTEVVFRSPGDPSPATGRTTRMGVDPRSGRITWREDVTTRDGTVTERERTRYSYAWLPATAENISRTCVHTAHPALPVVLT